MPHVASDTGPKKSLVAKIDEDVHDALVAWAVEEDRSLAAQTRIALRKAVPAKYLTPEK